MKLRAIANSFGVEAGFEAIAAATSDGAKASQEAPPASVFERSSLS